MDPSQCRIELEAPDVPDDVPKVNITESGYAYFQCEVLKVEFFLGLTILAVVTQVILLLCSLGSLIWYSSFRNVSTILKTLVTSPHLAVEEKALLSENEREKDFWFLLDLIAHSSGMV